jgi:hypothetical protein
MAESLHPDQIEEVLRLGAWRDAGHRFAVGMNGKVFTYDENKEETQNDFRQRQGASAASASPAASRTASHPESGGAHRSQALTDRYLGFRPEILRYYPSAHFLPVDHGLWVTARIYPLGIGTACYWICLFLPDDAIFSPKAFAFHQISPVPRPVGPRHTNFPDGSICAFTDADDAWRPGDDPKILLNLYAEWLVCQLFLRIEKRWPGRQVGLDAAYRQIEFGPDEWCDCGSDQRYGACHAKPDAAEVETLKASGTYEALPGRAVPISVLDFARSRWTKVPDLNRLPMHRYAGLAPH